MALTCNDNRLTTPDDVRLLQVLAPSLALTRLVAVRASSHLSLPEPPVFRRRTVWPASGIMYGPALAFCMTRALVSSDDRLLRGSG